MREKACTSPMEGFEAPREVDIRLPENGRVECLLMKLQGTHRRAARLLTHLVEAVHQPEPDRDCMQELAMGIRFEVQLAEALTQQLADGEATPGDSR